MRLPTQTDHWLVISVSWRGLSWVAWVFWLILTTELYKIINPLKGKLSYRLLFCFLLLAGGSAVSQKGRVSTQDFPDLKFRHLTLANGLPSDKVNFTYKDFQNLLWIGTGSELIRYDGRNYKVYSDRIGNHTGFYGKGVARMIKDSLDNFWIGGNTQGLNYYDRKHERFEHLFYKPKAAEEYIIPQYIDHKKRLWLHSSTAQELVTYSLATHKFEIKIDSNKCYERAFFYPAQMYQAVQFIVSTGVNGFRLFRCKNGEIVSYKDYFSASNKAFPMAIFEHKMVLESPEKLWLIANIGLVEFNSLTEKYRTYRLFEGRDIGNIQCITQLNARYLMLGTSNNGIFIFDTQTRQFVKNIRHLDNDPNSLISNSIEDIYCDAQKNIFVSQMNKGVDIAVWSSPFITQFIPRQSTEQFQTDNHLQFIRRINATTFWCVNESNIILEWDNTANTIKEPPALKRLNQKMAGKKIREIYVDDVQNIWVLSEKSVFYKDRSKADFENIYDVTNAQSIVQLDTDSYLVASTTKLYYLKKDTQWQLSEVKDATKAIDQEALKAISTIHFDRSNNMVYLMAEWGQVVCQFKRTGNSFTFLKRSDWSNNAVPSPTFFFSDSNFVLLPSNVGLMRYDIKNDSFKKLCYGQIGSDNSLSWLVRYGANTFYALSNNSLVQIKLPNWVYSKVELPISGTIKESLLYSSLYCGGDKYLYLSSNDGIVRYDPTQKTANAALSQIFVSTIEINGRSDALLNAANQLTTLTLAPEANNVDIFISNTNFADGNLLNEIGYKIVGLSDDLQMIDESGRIHLNKLPIGEYTLVIADRKTSKVLKQLQIIAKPYWYQTTWFFLFLLLLTSLAIYTVYRNRLFTKILRANLHKEEAIRKQQAAELEGKEAQFQHKLAEIEMSALRAQMNPHFIFNCLNSIQLFTAQNQADKASDYLSKFSRLIRLVLENSRSERVTLDNELETLRLYIELEAMRFRGKVAYFINVAPQIAQDTIEIPPLLLQPFVENAIWHGLMHKEEGGTVRIDVTQPNESLLHVEISDDGVGRAQAVEFKSKSATKNKSFGMQVTADRIQLINQLYNTQTQVNIIDLKDANGQATGTRVIVEIPI